jgi:hypothetical protein
VRNEQTGTEWEKTKKNWTNEEKFRIKEFLILIIKQPTKALLKALSKAHIWERFWGKKRFRRSPYKSALESAFVSPHIKALFKSAFIRPPIRALFKSAFVG